MNREAVIDKILRCSPPLCLEQRMTAAVGWSQASLLRPELVLLVDTGSWSSSRLGSRVFLCRPEI